MPTYTFYDEKTGKEWDDMMPNSERETYLKENPHITQVPGGFAFVGDHIMGMGPKQDGGMTENLQRIAAAHPGSALADRYSNDTTKSIKTREVLKKHKVI
jgi:hypothetical protein|tara:strand:- start:966 stop:1265 length:300 start_codon:yes stop_codon:yes gene_type:complete